MGACPGRPSVFLGCGSVEGYVFLQSGWAPFIAGTKAVENFPGRPEPREASVAVTARRTAITPELGRAPREGRLE